jgi:hypothetical protein
MRYGIMSAQGAKRLGIPQGTPVKYELHIDHYPESTHPSSSEVALKVWQEKDDVYVGGYVSIGPDGIIAS